MKEIDTRIMVYHDLQKKLTRKIAHKYKIHYNEYALLQALNFCDGQRIDDLDENVEQLKSALSSLEEKKYIYIKHEHVFLNENAKKEYKKIKGDIKKEEERFLDKIGDETYRQTLNSLDKLIYDLNEHLNA